MECSRLAAGILAGGRSSRMGENKAFLQLKEQSFLERILDACEIFGERLVSVDDRAAYEGVQECREGVILVEDVAKEYGPLEGIYQTLRAMSREACLILATDMPLVSGEFLRSLCEVYEDEDCLVLTFSGRPQPLCSIYHRRCLPILEKLRKEQIRRPRMLFDRVKTRYVPIEELGFDPLVIRNVNTPKEYEELTKR